MSKILLEPNPLDRLTEKVAIVFGAGPNIGGTIAHFLAREGARTVVCDVDQNVAKDTAAYISEKGYTAKSLQGDATQESDVEEAVQQTISYYGVPNIVVNMAGQIHWSPVVDMDLEGWLSCLTSYPTAAMLTTKYAARAMIGAGARGSIIHLLSTAAHFGEASGSAYTAAKAAVLNFSRSAAMDLAHDGIRVNTISPCAMEHQLWTKMRDEITDPSFKRPDRRSFYSRDDYLKMIPLERFPRASDLAWTAVFLASDESNFTTGTDIAVDGGLRHKYPTWTPGDYTGVDIEDYSKGIRRTEFGDETDKPF